MVALHNLGAEPPRLPGLTVEPLTPPVRSAGYDLAFDFVETDGGLTGHLEYNTGLFDADTAERLAARLRVLLEAAAEDPALPVGRLPLMTGAERRQVPPVRAGRPAARAGHHLPAPGRGPGRPHPHHTALVARGDHPGLRRAEPARQPARPPSHRPGRRPRGRGRRTAPAHLRPDDDAPSSPSSRRAPPCSAWTPHSRPSGRTLLLADARPHTLLTGLDAVPWDTAARPGSDRHRPDPAPAATAHRVHRLHLRLHRPPQGRRRRTPAAGQPVPRPPRGPARPARTPPRGAAAGPRSAPPSPSTPPGKDPCCYCLSATRSTYSTRSVRLDPEAFCAQVA